LQSLFNVLFIFFASPLSDRAANTGVIHHLKSVLSLLPYGFQLVALTVSISRLTNQDENHHDMAGGQKSSATHPPQGPND
jgi:hypothetical protein